MNLTRAEWEWSDRTVEYIVGGEEDEFPLPVLIIPVEDFEDATEIIATLERSRARKRTGKDTEPTKEPPAPPAPQWGHVGADSETWHLWWPDSSEAACGATSDAEIVFAEPVEGETPVCYRCARRAGPKAARKRKPTTTPAPVADPAFPPGDAAGAGNGCEVPGCKYDADHGQRRCREHAGKAVA